MQNSTMFSVWYLGHGISAVSKTISTDWTFTIQHIPLPETTTHLDNSKLTEGFGDLVGDCRMWISNFSMIVSPLYAMTGESFLDQEVWDSLSKMLLRTSRTVYFQFQSLDFTVTPCFFPCIGWTRGSALGLLSQKDNGHQRPPKTSWIL